MKKYIGSLLLISTLWGTGYGINFNVINRTGHTISMTDQPNTRSRPLPIESGHTALVSNMPYPQTSKIALTIIMDAHGKPSPLCEIPLMNLDAEIAYIITITDDCTPALGGFDNHTLTVKFENHHETLFSTTHTYEAWNFTHEHDGSD